MWLKVTAVIIGLFVPLFFLGSMRVTSAVPRVLLSLVSLNAQSFDANTTRFVTAVAAGFMSALCVMVWCLQAYVYDACPEGVRRSVVCGFLTWYLVESIGSVLSDNPWNLISNTFILLLIIGPLWKPATHMEGTASQSLVSS